MRSTELVKACPVCGGEFSPTHIVFSDKHHPETLHYYKCLTCGLYALSPRFTDAYTKEYYSGEYRGEVNPLHITDKLQHLTRARTQMELAGHLFAGKTMLELGCSSGYLLNEFKERGFKVVGVDPDALIEEDKFTRWYADISEVPHKKFDVIAMSHMLEHVNHPREFLETLVKHYAKHGTRVMIDVPNQPECFPLGVYRPHHPLAFDIHSLSYLMEAVGIKPIFDTAHGNGEPRRDNLLVVGEVQ